MICGGVIFFFWAQGAHNFLCAAAAPTLAGTGVADPRLRVRGSQLHKGIRRTLGPTFSGVGLTGRRYTKDARCRAACLGDPLPEMWVPEPGGIFCVPVSPTLSGVRQPDPCLQMWAQQQHKGQCASHAPTKVYHPFGDHSCFPPFK